MYNLFRNPFRLLLLRQYTISQNAFSFERISINRSETTNSELIDFTIHSMYGLDSTHMYISVSDAQSPYGHSMYCSLSYH